MRWLIFAIFVYLAFALDIGLRTMPIWSIQTSVGPVSPDLVLILAIYFGLWAPPRTAAWVMLILGLLVDLTTQRYTSAAMNPSLAGPNVVAIVGPNALVLAGAYAVVQFRGLLYRESAVSVAIMVFAVGVMVNLVTLLLLTVRGLPWLLGEPIPNWSAAEQLVYHFKILFYTAVVAAPLSRVLGRVRRGLWGLETAKSHGFRR